MLKLADKLTQAAIALRAVAIDEPLTEARVLAAGILGWDRARLLAEQERALSSEEETAIDAAVARRVQGEPAARILGRREFWSLDIAVNEATLIPRPDSETLIDAALALFPDRRVALRILDLGTGSGCLLLALLSEFPCASGLGVDCSEGAVAAAKANAARLNFEPRAVFAVGDWNDPDFCPRLAGKGGFDLIISNPPYIARDAIEGLQREVRDYEPLPALDGGEDGLDAYRALAPILPHLCRPDGKAVLEIGFDQAIAATEIFRQAGFNAVRLKRDLAGRPRCLVVDVAGQAA